MMKISDALDPSIIDSRARLHEKGFDCFLCVGLSEKKQWVKTDALNGRRIIRKPYFLYKPHRFNKGGDIKASWDHCRGYDLPFFALASASKLKEAFTGEKSVFYLGLEWSSPMEVSFRAINIICSIDMLKNEYDLVEKVVVNVLISHLAYLENNYEKSASGHTNNHFLSNLIAVFLIRERLGLPLGSLSNEVEGELEKQFVPDGSNFEGSTAYHFLATELVCWLYLLALDLRIKKSALVLLIRSKLVCRLLLRGDGSIPLIGDNDSGVVSKLYVRIGRTPVDYNYALTSFNPKETEFLWDYRQRCDFIDAVCGWPSKDDAGVGYALPSYEMSGLDKLNVRLRFVFNIDYGKVESTYLKGLSLLLIRSDNFQLTLKCGELGQLGRGGHDHNDQLSITYYSRNSKEEVRDPGTVTYSKAFPELFRLRNIDCHNGYIDKRQKSFDSLKPFSSKHPPGACFMVNENEWVGVVEYPEFKVARSIVISEGYIKVFDYYDNKKYLVDYDGVTSVYAPCYGVLLGKR